MHTTEPAYIKNIFTITAIGITLLMLLLSSAYGFSGDEWLQMKYGFDIWNYYATGSEQALNYNNLGQHYYGQEYYGGLFELIAEILHRLFSGVDYIYIRHFLNALTGSLLMIYTGLLARRLSSSWVTGLLAMLFMFLSPRIFGESMNNSKDIPFACGFTITLCYFVAFLQEFPVKAIKNTVGLAAGFALCFGTRFAGGIMLLAFMVLQTIIYYTQHKELKSTLTAGSNKLLKKALMHFSLAIVAGYIIAIFAWPWALQSPLSNPFATLSEMANRQSHFKVLFEGVYRMNTSMPWYYELKWILMTSPLIVIAGVLVFIIMLVRGIKTYGSFNVALLLCCAFIPLIIIIYNHATVYDTWRHVFFTYSSWTIMAALAVRLVKDVIVNPKLKATPYYTAVLCLLPGIIWMLRSHPHQYVYFNEAAGGVKGAYGKYDIDYYQNSAKQATDWIKENTKSGRQLIIQSNMLGIDRYFEKEKSYIKVDTGLYEQRHYLNYDYYISSARYIPVAQLTEGKWPPQNVVFTESIDGIPLCVVIAKKSHLSNEAYAAFQKEDYSTAAKKYEAYLRVDSLDEAAHVNYAMSLLNLGEVEKAIAELNTAISFNPNNAGYYNGLRGIYEALGDQAKMQEAADRVNAIIYEENELNGNQE